MKQPTPSVAFDEGKIDGIFAHLNQCHLPGAAVGIAIGGRPVYRKGFGLANMELPVVLSPSTRMRVYSVTKHFTCLAYMLLCEDGKASIDDPIGRHFPEFHRATGKVSMRQLMGNISGIRDAHGLHFQFSGTQWTAPSSQVIQLYETLDDVDAEPGTSWSYNSGGFVLISHAIERITGKTLGEVMRERIFEPVGMPDTLLRRTDIDFVPGSASMHMTSPGGGFIKSFIGGDRSGTGGIVSTVNDMLCWLRHMDAPMVGNPDTWSLLKAPQTLANGTSTGYGLGLMRDSYRGVETLHHPGGGMGANAQMLKVPSAGLDVAIMVNREDVSSRDLSLKILDAVLPDLQVVREAPAEPCVSGLFRSPATGRVIRLLAEQGRQVAQIGGFFPLPFAADADGVLRTAKTAILPYKYSITPIGDRENPAALRYEEYGNVDELVRVEPARTQDVGQIAGHYRYEAAGFDVRISDAGMLTTGRFGSVLYSLECLAQEIWRVRDEKSLAIFQTGILVFDATGFRFWSSCAHGLPFRRVG